MPVANIRITKGPKTLHGWYIHPIPYEMTIQEFYDKIVIDQITEEFNVDVNSSDIIEYVEISKSQNTFATKTNLNCNIIELINNFGINIHYHFKSDQSLPPSSFQNGLSIIMKHVQRDQLYLPIFSQPSKPNRKQILQQDIINWIKDNGGGWSSSSFANLEGKKFVVNLTEVIWYIDMRDHNKFKERSYHIPPIFMQFFGRANPESYKEGRKRFDLNELNLLYQSLAHYLATPWMLTPKFKWLLDELDSFVVSISGYISFLRQQKEISAKNHNSEVSVRNVEDATSVKIHNHNTWIAPVNKTKYYDLVNTLTNTPSWKPIDIEEYLPTDPMQRLRYIQGIAYAFPFKAGECRLNSGNNVFNTVSVWKIDDDADETTILRKNTSIINNLQINAPKYHTRAMRINYLRTCDMLLPKVRPAMLQSIYKMLTGDMSASESLDEKIIDTRIRLALDLGDPEISTDLREHNIGRPSKYDAFWKVAAQFLAGKTADAVVAVDERCHDTVVHLATAISVNDLLQQIRCECTPETIIPSAQWFRLQFWPKNPSQISSFQYTGRLPLKYMVQIRQLRAYHQDAHYASALFRYEKEFAVKFRNLTNLVFLDDTHRCKVGEPGFPVAAVERGKRVVISKDSTFVVGDHDYTKTGIVPSVTMICDIPESIDGDFYNGNVYISLKDPIFQPSSPIRHSTELYHILLDESFRNKPILCLYTDGGPDHRCTFMCVQLSYICLFLALDLDYFVAVRTPPQHSWKNLVERIMSILNLGLQCVGLMRSKMDDQLEILISKANNMSEIRRITEKNPTLKTCLIESLQQPIRLIRDIFERQSLKEVPFETYDAATEEEIESFWETIHIVDDSVIQEDRTMEHIKKKLKEFMDHCCTIRHYFFTIKKCGKVDCCICRPCHCTPEEFEQLKQLPDPISGEDLHYKSFEELYGTPTTEKHRPSLKNSKPITSKT
ncbi:4076_t:CDS:2, partial [Scutellospora calospora]